MGAPCFPYTEELGNEICKAISTTSLGLKHLCAANPHWPEMNKIYEWVIEHPTFGDKYARARELQQDVLIEDVITRSYDNSNDTYIGEDGRVHSNMAAIQRDRLIADNAKWVAGRLSRRYKDKQQVDTNVTISHEDTLKDLS